MSDEKIGYQPEGTELKLNNIDPPKQDPDLNINPPPAVAPDSDPAISPPTNTFEGENVNQLKAVAPDQESIKTGGGQEVNPPDVADTETAQLIHAFIDELIKNLDKNYPNWKNDLRKLLLELKPNLNNLNLNFEPDRDKIITKPNWRIKPAQNLAENLPSENSPYWQEKLAEAQKGQPTTSENQPPTAKPPTPKETATDAKKPVEQSGSDRLA